MKALRHAWLTRRRELLGFPWALLGAFVVVTWMMRDPAIRFTLARAYLGFFVPLAAGLAAAYAILDDTALELKFATPASALRTLVTAVGPLLAVHAACALAFQLATLVMGVDLSPLGGVLAVQRAWLVPAVALSALATAGALAGAHPASGAFLAAAVWLVQLLMKGWLLANGPWLYLFMGVLEPDRADLAASQASLVLLSLALLVGSWAMLRRQERYL